MPGYSSARCLTILRFESCSIKILVSTVAENKETVLILQRNQEYTYKTLPSATNSHIDPVYAPIPLPFIKKYCRYSTA